MPGEAELVMFAMRSAVRLGQQAREAYVDATRGRALILPLPNFDSAPDPATAAAYFARPGKRHVGESPRLRDLLAKHTAGDALSPGENAELIAFHDEFLLLDLVEAGITERTKDGRLYTAQELNALITIRQWRPGADPSPSVLKRFAGTFIELGVDYLVNVPGALNQQSKYGRALHAFLGGLESFDFAEGTLGTLPERLFTAALETVSEQGDLFSGDPKVQELMTITTRALTQDVGARIQRIRAGGGSDSVVEGRVAEWAELVFRNVLASGGRMVLADPKGLLGVKAQGEAALITHVGEAVLGLVLDQPEGKLDRVFGREGIESVLKAGLTAVGKHPEILASTKNAGLQKLLGEIAEQLGGFDTLLAPSVLPELARLILDKTGDHLELLWPDLVSDPRKHLLLTTAKTALDVLTKPAAAGQPWTPSFGRDELIALSETVFDELIQNPAWLLKSAEKTDKSLALALEAALGVLRSRGDRRLGTDTAVEVLRAAVRAVALRSEFLDALPAGAAMAGRPILAAALDAMIGTIFGDALPTGAAWRVVRAEVVVGVVRIGLDELAKLGPSEKALAALRASMNEQAALLAAGKPWDLASFESGLRAALAHT